MFAAKTKLADILPPATPDGEEAAQSTGVAGLEYSYV